MDWAIVTMYAILVEELLLDNKNILLLQELLASRATTASDLLE